MLKQSVLLFSMCFLVLLLPLTPVVSRVCAQERKIIVSVEEWHPFSDALAIKTGNLLRLEDYFYDYFDLWVPCFDSDGNEVLIEVLWDLSGVDVNKPGLYEAVGIYQLPEGWAFGPDTKVSIPRVPVSVQNPGIPQIDCFLMGRGTLIFPWVGFNCPLDEVAVQISENHSKWRRLLDEEIRYLDENQLILSSNLFETGVHYALQVTYTGGQTGILSFVYDDENMVYNYNEGNRDGDDALEPVLPDQIQPVPPSDSNGAFPDPIGSPPLEIQNSDTMTNTSKPASLGADRTPSPSQDGSLQNQKEGSFEGQDVYEKVTETTTSVTGARLKQMAADYPKAVPFAWNGMMLLLSPEFISGLSLSEDALFSVTMERQGDRTFSVLIDAGGLRLTALEGAQMRISLNDAGTIKGLYSKTSQMDIPFSTENNVLSFPLSHTGDYAFEAVATGHNAAKTTEPSPAADTVLITLGSLLAVLGAGFWYFYKRNKKKHEKAF